MCWASLCHKDRERERVRAELPACAGFLFMSGDFYQVQAVPCSLVGSTSESALCVFMRHHHRLDTQQPALKGLRSHPHTPSLTWDLPSDSFCHGKRSSFTFCAEEEMWRTHTHTLRTLSVLSCVCVCIFVSAKYWVPNLHYTSKVRTFWEVGAFGDEGWNFILSLGLGLVEGLKFRVDSGYAASHNL